MASIDKLSLVLPESEFLIDSLSSKLRIKPRDKALDESRSDELDHLVYTKSGRSLYGRSIYCNTDRVNVTISKVRDGSVSMVVATNPNKWHHPWQTSTDPAKYREFRSGLESEISEMGISCDLSSARIARLDLARQKKLSHPLRSYHPIFDALEAKRQHESRHADSIRIGNRQRQTAIYDKHIEARLEDSQRNLVRVETRFLRPKTTSRYAEIQTLADLDRCVKESSFEHLSSVYSRYLSREIFANIPEEIKPVAGYLSHARELARESRYRLLDRFIVENGILTQVGKAGGSSELADILTIAQHAEHPFKTEQARKQYRRRMVKEIQEHFGRAMGRKTVDQQSFTSLYHEIASFAESA